MVRAPYRYCLLTSNHLCIIIVTEMANNTLTQQVGTVRSTIDFPPEMWVKTKEAARRLNVSVRSLVVEGLELRLRELEQERTSDVSAGSGHAVSSTRKARG